MRFGLYIDKLVLREPIQSGGNNLEKCKGLLTKEQIEFLDKVCFGSYIFTNGKVDVYGSVDIKDMNLTEIPVKFGRVDFSYDSEGRNGGYFSCSYNNLTTLKNCPDFVEYNFFCSDNNLTDYFKSIKEEDFNLWDNLDWRVVLKEYPFLINIGIKYLNKNDLETILSIHPLTKLYLK